MLTAAELLAFLRRHRLAVQASRSAAGGPQAAVVGFAVSDELEIVFDTETTSRKYANLMADPRIALVVGWDDEVTAQLEGVADFPTGKAAERIREVYFGVYPDGRERMAWPDICHVRVRPSWARLSGFNVDPPRIEELRLDANTDDAPAPTRAGFPHITPRIVVADEDQAAALCAFMRRAFDAHGALVAGRPAEMRIASSVVMVSAGHPREPFAAFLYIYVEDADRVYQRALAAGAESIEPPLDTRYGDRRAMVRDPFGNVWQIAHVARG
jgi:uncharacterized glyoxalase superfamily protein PhnB